MLLRAKEKRGPKTAIADGPKPKAAVAADRPCGRIPDFHGSGGVTAGGCGWQLGAQLFRAGVEKHGLLVFPAAARGNYRAGDAFSHHVGGAAGADTLGIHQPVSPLLAWDSDVAEHVAEEAREGVV